MPFVGVQHGGIQGFFVDAFSEASDPSLGSHIPDIGDSWTIVTYDSYAGDIIIVSSTSKASPTLDATGEGIAAIAEVTYPSADYKVEANAQSIANLFGETFGLIARYVDSSNYYVAFVATAAGTDIGIFKMVAGVPTDLISADLDNNFNTAAHDVRLEVSGSSTTTLTLFIDNVQQLTITDSSSPYTAAGKGGIAFGTAVDQINDVVDKDWGISRFSITAI